MDDCPFCKIARGELPCLKIYEDALTLAFLDIARDADGHILVIPKRHAGNLLDCDTDTLCAIARTVQTVSAHMTDHCGFDGINLLHASGESAGQSVPHLHVHLLPRKKGDGLDAWPALPGAKRDIRDVHNEITMLPDS